MVALMINKIKQISGLANKVFSEESMVIKDNITSINTMTENKKTNIIEIPEKVKMQYRDYLKVMKSETITNVYLSNKQVLKRLLQNYHSEQNNMIEVEDVNNSLIEKAV